MWSFVKRSQQLLSVPIFSFFLWFLGKSKNRRNSRVLFFWFWLGQQGLRKTYSSYFHTIKSNQRDEKFIFSMTNSVIFLDAAHINKIFETIMKLTSCSCFIFFIRGCLLDQARTSEGQKSGTWLGFFLKNAWLSL